MAHQPARRFTGQALRREPQHQQHQRAKKQQAIFGQTCQSFGQQHDDQCAHQRPGDRAGATDHHHQHEQDRLRKRERRWCDKAGQRREQAASEACAHC